MSYQVPCVISIYFGLPGSGKTTFATYLTKKDLKHHCKVYSNVPIIGAYQYNPKEDLGSYDISQCRVILDEASIEFNNRNFKSMPLNVIKWLKLHRHYKTAVDVFSQSYDDMDVTIRRLAQNLYIVRKSIIPFFVVRRTIQKRIGIDEMTHQIIDEFSFRPFSRKWIFTPTLWSMFDTTDAPALPKKEFSIYENTSVDNPEEIG